MQHLDDWSPSDFEILWESSVVLSAGTRVCFRWDVGFLGPYSICEVRFLEEELNATRAG